MNGSSRPATIWERMGALVLDYIFITGMFFVAVFLIFAVMFLLDLATKDLGTTYSGYIAAVVLIFYFAYAVFYYSQISRRYAQTLGEKIMKIKVVPLNDNKIGPKAAFWRIFFLCVPILELLSIYYASVNKKQSFLDTMCNTLTIKEF